MNKIELLLNAVDANRALMDTAEDYLWKNPETGYREWKSTAYLEKEYEKLGYTLTRAGNIPGFVTELDTGKPGPTVLVLAELDSLLCADHPAADPETGAVHACGHCAQGAALLGVAAALKTPGALDGLSGKIRLGMVPAEELLEIGYREGLRKQGIIRYFGGKAEFLYRGLFDGVDMSFMIHQSAREDCKFDIHKGNNGCMVKNIEFHGVASHAGGSPDKGINALYAANLALNAINSLRETFIDEDHIRVHPIITKGGDAVNAIPNTVTLESYVRGATLEAIDRVNRKVNRALCGAAAAMGANVEICDRPGYVPLVNEPNMTKFMADAMAYVVPREEILVNDSWSKGCTDMGDMSSVMPVVHPHVAGSKGHGHGNDYYIVDNERAIYNSAKAQVALLEILLSDDAKNAKYVLDNAHPLYTREEYFAALDRETMDRAAAIDYSTDGKATIDYAD